MLRTLYRTYIHSPAFDRHIYRILDVLTDIYAFLRGYSFPKNYIRRWKLDMLRELYEKETVALFKRTAKSGMVIADIGAHIGYYARIAARRVGNTGAVYAFEADPENFTLLKKNIRKFRNIKPCQLAITDKSGVVDFYHYDDKSGAHSTLPNVPLDFQKRKLTVPSCDLDSWLAREGIARVDIIKMDIEGGETSAIRGMARTLGNAKALITEFAPAWINASGSTAIDFLQSIEQYGFKICAVTTGGLINLSPVNDERFISLLPKPRDGSHQSEFINLYCVK